MGNRVAEIQAEVQAKGHIWDCFDQGRWAHASGAPIAPNPHRINSPGYFHANMTEWERGWKAEAGRVTA